MNESVLNSVQLGANATSFSKLMYLVTCFQDGKEINDLLTTLINKFENIASFLQVMEGCKLLDVLSSARELINLIGTTGGLRSELLGKAYGVKLETYIDLIGRHPELLDGAIKMSDLAMAEFTAVNDLQRRVSEISSTDSTGHAHFRTTGAVFLP